jgi:hypothetical protein
MEIAVLIMAANMQPSTRNVEAFKDTVVRYVDHNKDKLRHQYTFFVYDSNPIGTNSPDVFRKDDTYDNMFYYSAPYEESVYRTFEKTYAAFKQVCAYDRNFGLYVRVNISMYLNISLLDAVAEKLKPHNIYCNAINSHVNLNSEYLNDIYPRGDLMIFDHYIMDIIIREGEKYLECDTRMKDRIGVDHVDDCLIGICLIDGIGKDYYQHLYMLKYNYLPDMEISGPDKINRYAIGSRIKTVPPEVGYSGYSWDDNDYRLKDVEKFKWLYEFYENSTMKYEGVKMPDVLVDKNNSRPTLFVHADNQSVFNVFWKYLEQKRK